MSILREIIEHKRAEVEADKKSCPQSQIESEIEREAKILTPRGFIDALRKSLKPSIIAEIKKASPSKGIIRKDLDPVTTAVKYAAGGAACISVLTESKFFLGELSYLKKIRNKLPSLPLLRKDFIVDSYQVYQTRAAGADAILLIVAALDEAELKSLLELSLELSLDVLIEVHDEQEMARALSLLETLPAVSSRVALGINNRNLSTFVTDLAVSVDLLSQFSERLKKLGLISISESAIEKPEDILMLDSAGLDAYLVGESLVKIGDPGENLKNLIRKTRELL